MIAINTNTIIYTGVPPYLSSGNIVTTLRDPRSDTWHAIPPDHPWRAVAGRCGDCSSHSADRNSPAAHPYVIREWEIG